MDRRFLFLSKIHPFSGAGAELRTWEMARRFVQRGAAVTILTICPPDLTDPPTEAEGVLFRYVPLSSLARTHSLRMAFLAPRLQFYLSRHPIFATLIASGDFDLILDDISPVPSIHSYNAASSAGIPKAATIHILQGTIGSWLSRYGVLGFGGALMEGGIRSELLRYDQIITPSKWLYESLREDLKGGVSWIPNGVDTERFRPARTEERRRETDGALRYLCVGRFVGWKGHRTLLHAFALLTESKVPKARLTLVGKGPKLESTRRLADRLGISSRVFFRGFVPDAFVPDVYRNADVFVLPSATEGMSFALMEAMSSGLPIIASDVPGNSAILDPDAAILVPPGEPRALAQAMGELAGQRERRAQMGALARQEALESFSWKGLADEQLTLLSSVAERVAS